MSKETKKNRGTALDTDTKAGAESSARFSAPARIRETGIDLIGHVPWGTHFCQFYQSEQDLIEILVPYFKAGLESNEFCMWVTSDPLNVEQAKQALRAAMPDLDTRLAKGQIEIIPHTEWYLKDGVFEQNRVLNGWVDKLSDALDRGYEGLRLTGNTFWLEKDDWVSFTDYEEAVNHTLGKYRMLALCTYSLERCGASEVADVVANHEFAIIKRRNEWTMVESSTVKQAKQALESALSETEDLNEELHNEIDERKKREDELHRLNRTLRAHGNSSRAMMRARNEVEYLDEICRIVVEDCGHAMVWIGYAEDDNYKSVRPVAYSGFEVGYLETLKITWANTERGRGPTGTAIRTGKPSMCKNMLTDPAFEPWREQAIERGYASSIVLPLMSEDKAFGALTIYCREPDPFLPDEVELLSSLADDLAYGIQALRLRAKHAEAEEVLQTTLRRFHTVLSSMNAAVLLVTQDNRVDFVNQAFCDMYHLPESPAELVGMTAQQMVEKIGNRYLNPDEAVVRIKQIVEAAEPVIQEEITFNGGLTCLRDFVPIYVNGELWGRFWQHVDITQRKRTEEALHQTNERLALLSHTASELLVTNDPQGEVQRLCEKIMAHLDCHAFFNYLVSADKQCLRLNAYAGIPETAGKEIERLDFGTAVCGCAARDACRIVAENIPDTPDPRTELVKSFGIKAYACHPLLGHEGGVIGTLSFGTRSRSHFSEDDLALMKTVADEVAIAMERIRLHQEAERRAEELQAIMDAVPALIWMTRDPEAMTISGSRAAYEFLRQPLGRNLSKSAPEGEKPVGYEVIRQGKALDPQDMPVQRSARGEELRDFEMDFAFADGTTRHAIGNATPLVDDEGNPRGSVAAFIDITERKQIEDAQLFLLQCGWPGSGDDFFPSLARYLASTLDMDFVCIDRLSGDCLSAETVAIYFDGHFEDNISYALKDTPCGDVVGKTVCCFPRDVRGLFPKDDVLQEMIAEGYIGTTLWSSSGEPIGLIALISRRPLTHPERAQSLLKLVAIRAAGELERKRMEDALRESEEHLRLFIEHAPAALALFDSNMHYLAASHRWLADYEVSRDDVIGRCHYDVFPEVPERWREIHRRCLAGAVERADEDRFEHADGSVQWLRWEVLPWRQASGAIGGIVIFSEDITERKKAQEALEKYRVLAERARDIMLFVGLDGRIVEANDAAVRAYGYTHEEMLELAIFDLRAPTTSDITAEQIEEADSTGILFDTVHRRKDGSVFPVEVSSRGTDIAGQRVLVSIIRDITERRATEQQRAELYDREHHIAEVLQQALIPPYIPTEFGNLAVGVRYQAALNEAEVGGDFYDVFDLGKGRVGVLIGDVAGKGLPAAMRVAAARYSVRSYAFIDPRPSHVMTLANEALCKESEEEINMLTAFLAVIDTTTGMMTYTTAGHEPPVVCSASGKIRELESGEIPLGIMEAQFYTEHNWALQPGDSVVIVTDGITEARAPGTILFKKKGMIEYLSNNMTSCPDEMAEGLMARATAHAGGRLQDDAAVVVLRLAYEQDGSIHG